MMNAWSLRQKSAQGYSMQIQCSSPALDPVKNAADAQAFLEQCALIAINSNHNTESSANILSTISFEGRIPEHVASPNSGLDS